MVHLLVAMLLFAFFAISGLVIDLGIARISQGRMAGATDTSAIEGLRLKTATPDADCRIAAAELLLSNFAYKFGVTPPDDPLHFGAGPDVAVVGGVGSMDALGTVTVGPNVVYLPTPESNLGNADHGDMVRGFVDVDDPTSPLNVEASDYSRTDFTTTFAPSLDEGFLVRLRRTPGTSPLDEQAGVSSRGPALPYLFARGSFMAAGMRAAGITVRATAIAAARRTTTVGLSNVPAGLVGAPVFVLEFDYWNSIPVNTDSFLRFQGSEILPPLVSPGQLDGPAGGLRGLLVDRAALPAPTAFPALTRTSWSIGDEVAQSTGLDTDWTEAKILDGLGRPEQPGYVDPSYYVPIYKADIGRIVGFGSIHLTSASDNGDGTWQVTIRKTDSTIAPLNASAVEAPGLAGLSSGTTQTVLGLLAQVDLSLRAAAIAR